MLKLMDRDERFAGARWEPFGSSAELDHVGLAIRSIADHSVSRSATEDPVQRVKLAFVSLHDAPVELVEPGESDSPVSRLLAAGNHLYHLCFRVPNLQLAVEEAKRNGFHRLGKPVPAPALGGRLIAWVFSRDYGLFELVEAETSEKAASPAPGTDDATRHQE
jgi:methylmalonyl-CoA/ethylmalonyl-CoA epimerase